MNTAQTLAAASLWAAGHDTYEIANIVGVKEAEIANRMELIRSAVRASKVRA